MDVDELKTAKKVEFVNYSGPVDIFQTDCSVEIKIDHFVVGKASKHPVNKIFGKKNL